MVDSVLSAGLAGVASGIAGAQQAAQDITSATAADRPTDNSFGTDHPAASHPSGASGSSSASIVSLSEAVVQLQTSELQVQASAKVVASADQVLGTLLDINA